MEKRKYNVAEESWRVDREPGIGEGNESLGEGVWNDNQQNEREVSEDAIRVSYTPRGIDVVGDPPITSNPFAITLEYYKRFCQSKLNEEDLSRVLKKYSKRPGQLLGDLQKKYIIQPPSAVSYVSLIRLVRNFNIPADYVAVLEIPPSVLSHYQPNLDVTRAEFDVEAAFSGGSMVTDYSSATPMDNMSKVTLIVPGLLTSEECLAVQARQSRLDAIGAGWWAETASKEARRHFFDRLADMSLPPGTLEIDPQTGEKTLLPSPYSLLIECMRNAQRVRVIIRRHSSLRGSIDGRIITFDKYFNLFLGDVDEEYIVNKQKKRVMKLGVFVNQHQVLHRRMKQLLVRGDNIVAIFRVPK